MGDAAWDPATGAGRGVVAGAVPRAVSDAAAATVARTYRVDPARSSVIFAARFLRMRNVRGEFTGVRGVLCDGPGLASARVEVDTESLFTSNRLRDRHLLSSHYLDVRRYPEISFSGKWAVAPKTRALANGVLVVRGIAQEVEVLGLAVEQGSTGAQLRVTGKMHLDRERFGLAELCVFGVRLGFRGALIAREITVEFDLTATELTGK